MIITKVCYLLTHVGDGLRCMVQDINNVRYRIRDNADGQRRLEHFPQVQAKVGNNF